MKSMLLVIIVFFVFTNLYSQEKYLSVSNTETNKESVFKQNEKVKIKTIQGGKIKGTLLILDETQIMVRNIIIPLSNIEKIKPNPIILNILVSAPLFIIGGYGILGGIVAIAWGGGIIGATAIVLGVASVTAGIYSPNPLPASKVNNSSKIMVKTVMQ